MLKHPIKYRLKNDPSACHGSAEVWNQASEGACGDLLAAAEAGRPLCYAALEWGVFWQAKS